MALDRIERVHVRVPARTKTSFLFLLMNRLRPWVFRDKLDDIVDQVLDHVRRSNLTLIRVIGNY